MRLLLCAALSLLAAASQTAAVAAEVRIVRLRWQDLGGMIGGKSVEILKTDGSKAKGRVRAVTDAAIEFEKEGTAATPRGTIAEIRLIEYVGNGRTIGKLTGGVVGLTLGLVGATVIGLREGSGSSAGAKAGAVAMAVGGLPAGMALGYLLGRQVDREVTTIRLIP